MNEIVAQKKCRKCGETKLLSEFHTNNKNKDNKNSTCKKCDYEYTKKWRSENPEQAKEQVRKWAREHHDAVIKNALRWAKNNAEKHNAAIDRWHKVHREKGLEANRRSAAKYPDKQLARTRKYREEHPDKSLTWTENRRALRIKDGGTVTAQEWRNVLNKYGNKCLCCGRTDIKITMDHVIPLSAGGHHSVDNIQPLCGSCNSKKNTKIIDYRPF
jgi:5-methylcytosine-specific restriction endonuclease McrA